MGEDSNEKILRRNVEAQLAPQMVKFKMEVENACLSATTATKLHIFGLVWH